MRIVSPWLVVAGVVAESVTCTVKLKLPEVSGEPEMIPVAGSSVRPPGSEPAVMDAAMRTHNTAENIDLRAEGLPDHSIRQRQGKNRQRRWRKRDPRIGRVRHAYRNEIVQH